MSVFRYYYYRHSHHHNECKNIKHFIFLVYHHRDVQSMSRIKEKSLFDVTHVFVNSRYKVDAVTVWRHFRTVHAQHTSHILFNVIHLNMNINHINSCTVKEQHLPALCCGDPRLPASTSKWVRAVRHINLGMLNWNFFFKIETRIQKK